MKRSGYLQQRDGRTQALLDVMQRTMKQYMLDTLLITMHEDFGWGYSMNPLICLSSKRKSM